MRERERSGHCAYREMVSELGDGKGKRRKRRKKTQFGAVFQLNLWYFASTISHILRKAKAFYNECCCDAYEDGKIVEVTLVDPYFSMPALPCTSYSMANCM